MEQTKKKSKDLVFYISRIATAFSILMYVSYIPQIMNNLDGAKSNPIQPLCAAINSFFWVAYGLTKAKKDWPVIIANLPGVALGLITFLTAL